MEKTWFASWFDSPYYPILYQHRDFDEAERFILNLVRKLNPPESATFLDLACGRGRHAKFINDKGFRVTGLDLSPDSIADAQKFTNDKLDFAVHDMRDPIPGRFDFILNLFTSFGYFDDPAENAGVLKEVRKGLKKDGTFVLDFMNVPKILDGLIPEAEKDLNGVHFDIRKQLLDGVIVKDIHVRDGQQEFHFQERVRALFKEDFESLFAAANLKVIDTWGDYDGNPWDEKTSPRHIFFCKALESIT